MTQRHLTEGERLPVRVLGWGTCIPDSVLSNAELNRRFHLPPSWIPERTGILERRVVSEHESTATLAVEAARSALTTAGINAADIDLAVVATTTPEQPLPHTGAFLAGALGVRCATFDINSACTGFVSAFVTAAALLQAGDWRYALVVGSETFSRVVDPHDRSTAVVFGDGAGAVVLSACKPGASAVLSWEVGCDPSGRHLVEIVAGGSRCPTTVESLNGGLNLLRMSGRDVFEFAVPTLVASARRTLTRAGVRTNQLAAVVPHQANARILDRVAAQLDLQPTQLIVNVDRYGNTAAASIPLALSEAAAAGRFRRSDLILMTAVGAGMTWGSLLLRW